MLNLASLNLATSELESHYASYPSDLSALEADLHALRAAHPAWSSFEAKAAGYALIAARCPVHIFRHFPFAFELNVGKDRQDLGNGGVGCWLEREPLGLELQAQGSAWWQPCTESGLSVGWLVTDDNHLCLGNDAVLAHGLRGLMRQAEARLATAATPEERAFLECVLAGHRAVLTVAERLGQTAREALANESDPAVRARLERTADTAPRVPAEPPATLYEALHTVLFMREVTQSLEGCGISMFGHLDRSLWPFYEHDLAAGRLTRAEAKELLAYFLAFSDARFGISHVSRHVGTNTTVGIGGCDAAGAPIFNDLTRLILELYAELHLVDPKLNARLSAAHPPAYYTALAELTAAGCNSLALFNDDVVIAANVKRGKALADARLYVGGGCQENVLENTESNNRATMYLNLAQVLLMGFFPGEWSWLEERDGLRLQPYAGAPDFETLYATFLANLSSVFGAHVAQRNRTEAESWRYNPCPLISSTMSDCLERARDLTQGGARYNSSSISLTGIGTVIDSLYALATLPVGGLSLPDLAAALAADFAGQESLRAYLGHEIPKFGQEDPAIRAFSARVFREVALAASGLPNTRGGSYEPSLFSFRLFVDLGRRTGATPDGRPAGAYLSPGMSPSLLALSHGSSVGQVLSALEPLDLTDYPVVAVLDVKLPAIRGRYPARILVPVFERFLAARGSVLQINTVDAAVLRDARAHPERHADLVVRVSGYSAYFALLPEAVQEEILERTELTA